VLILCDSISSGYCNTVIAHLKGKAYVARLSTSYGIDDATLH